MRVHTHVKVLPALMPKIWADSQFVLTCVSMYVCGFFPNRGLPHDKTFDWKKAEILFLALYLSGAFPFPSHCVATPCISFCCIHLSIIISDGRIVSARGRRSSSSRRSTRWCCWQEQQYWLVIKHTQSLSHSNQTSRIRSDFSQLSLSLSPFPLSPWRVIRCLPLMHLREGRQWINPDINGPHSCFTHTNVIWLTSRHAHTSSHLWSCCYCCMF